MLELTKGREAWVLSITILVYWSLYWGLNVIDKFIVEPTLLWKGKDRVTQFSDYLASIGIHSPFLVWVLIAVVTVAEITAFLFAAGALTNLLRNRTDTARTYFFWSTVTGIAIFTAFSVGDQIFGDRAELWEHGTFVILIGVSWLAYRFYNPAGNELHTHASSQAAPSTAATRDSSTRRSMDLVDW